MISTILLMAGSGTRMKSDINKVLLPYKDKKIYEVSLELFKEYSDEIICVTNQNDKIVIPGVKTVYGGKTRQESVYNALKECSNDYVIIHDAARPLLAKSVLEEIIGKISLDRAILTASKVKNTIKQIENNCLVTLNRDKLVSASTPQCAPRHILLESHNKALNDEFISTDDISLIERYFPDMKIEIVIENEENFKVTTPLDYKILKIIGETRND